MADGTNKIRIKAFEYLWEIENGHSSHELHQALQSIPKRLNFCIYHYYLLLDLVNDPTHVSFDSFAKYTRANSRVPLRVEYEANFYAFVQSLHALIDSLPYILFLYEPVNTDDNKAYWNKGFLKLYKHGYPYYSDLKSLFLNDRFHQVKGLVNKAKHGYLIRILNNKEFLEIEEFTYKMPNSINAGRVNTSEQTVPQQDLIKFITACHDELIPEYIKLFDKLMNNKATKLNITDMSVIPGYNL